MALEFLLAIIWLLVVSFGLGFAITREKSIMTFGFGLAVFAALSIVFTLAHIPLNWFLFLALAMISLGYSVYKKELGMDDLKSLKMPDKTLMLVLLMAAINIYVYYIGATSYPWLEDDDPWIHAMGVEWVAQTGSYARYFDGAYLFRLYIEPYPPAFDNLMGVIHQIVPSASATLKFFNAFLIGATLVMAFCAIEAMAKDRRLALFATFLLLAVPAFMGHFIWAQTLAMLFFFVAFYGLESGFGAEGWKRWMIASGIAIGAIAISQPSTAVIFIPILAIYAIVKFSSMGQKILKPILLAGVVAVLLTATYYVPVFMKYGTKYALDGIGVVDNLFAGANNVDTSGGVVYTAEDFLFVQPTGKIDQHIGIGFVLVFLALAGFALSINEMRKGKMAPWMLFFSAILVFCFIGVEGNAMPVKLFPHRFWVFLAVPVAVLGAYAYLRIEERFSKHRTLLLAVFVLAVFLTSAAGKMTVQTSQWPPGVMFASQEELSGYLSLKASFPVGTKVFPLCSADGKVIGFDMSSEPYVPEYEIFKRTAMNRSVQEVHDFMVSRGYGLMTLDSGCVQALGADKANALANAYLTSPLFEKAYSTQGMMVLKAK